MATTQPRVLVFGTGSVGAVYSWILCRAVTPANVYCICRSNFEAASTHGFTINSTIFGNNLNFKPQVARTVEDAVSLLPVGEKFDYVVVTAKAIPTTPSMPERLRPAIGPNTKIALIQNGISIEEPWVESYPSNPLLSCVVYLPATQTKPGTISHREVELLHIGTYPSNHPTNHERAAVPFSTLINKGGGTTKLHEDIQPQRFSKLLVNASWNPICALSLSRDAQFLHSALPVSLELIEIVMTEISRIAQACGCKDIDASTVEHQLNRAKVRALPGIEPSMLADAKNHARMEVDAIVGNAVRLAEEKGVSTPLLRAIYALVKALDQSFEMEAKAKDKEAGKA